jgi:hypothetical protein
LLVAAAAVGSYVRKLLHKAKQFSAVSVTMAPT